MPDCRARRMAEFSRYSLLYADKVVFPIYVPTDGDPVWLNGNLRILAELRPLLDVGIVVPTESAPCLCKDCSLNYSDVFSRVETAAREAASAVRVTYLGQGHTGKKKLGEWLFRFTWPAEYEPAPAPLLYVNKLPAAIASFVADRKNEGLDVPTEMIRESAFLMMYFQHTSEDFILHNLFSRAAGCVDLSDSASEVSRFRSLAGCDREESRNEVFASMAHNVPLFADIRLETLVKVRQQDGEAFAAYRAALNEAANEASQRGTTAAQSQEIFSDVIQPKLTALERKHDVLRERIKKDALINYGVPFAALAIGAISGATHPMMGNLLQLAGGLDLVKTLAKQIHSLNLSEASLDTVKADPLYFLLRIKREHEKDCHA